MRIWTIAEHSLTPGGVEIRPDSMQVTEKGRQSTASISEEMTAEARSTGTWIRDDRFGVWRISRVEENPVTRTRTIQLEHIWRTLADRIIPGEVTSGDMGGGDTATCAQAVRKILSYQSDWVLGACEYGAALPYSFDGGEDLASALETVFSSLEDPCIECDTGRYPFVMNIRRPQSGAACEMRMDRNITTMRRTIDRTRMFTRFYPVGKEDIRLPGAGYMSRNEGIYGIIEKSQTDQSRETEAELRAWADEQLRNHARPSVSISISGLELVGATGEPMDALTVDRICRVPLPEYGTVIEARIIQKNWADVIGRPEDVTVMMGNEVADVAQIIRQEVTGSTSTAARGGRGGAKKAKEDHAWFVDTEDHVAMVAEAVAGEGASKDWSRVAEILVDGKGIHQRVTYTENQIVTHEAKIEVTEKQITQEVQDRSNADQKLSGRITVEADRITQEVTRASTAEGQLNGRITVEAGKISQVVSAVGADGRVTAASIVTAINNGSSSIQLKADHIDIDGLVTRLQSKDIQCYGIEASTGTFDDYCYAGLAFQTPYGNLGVRDVTASGNTLTIRYADGRPDVNFSKATTLTLNWSGGVCTGIAKQNGTEVARKTSPISVSGSNEITSNGTHTYKVMYEDSAGEDIETGCQKTITVNVSHSPTADCTPGWTGNVGDRELLATISAGSAARTYILIDAKCGGKTKKYYIRVNQ